VSLRDSSLTGNEPEYIPGVWKDLFSLFESGKVKANVFETVWSLEDLAQGLDALEKRKTWGKVVVRVRKDDEMARL